jgi:hypothetical protein
VILIQGSSKGEDVFSIKDYNPDTQIPLQLAAEMVGATPKSLLQLLADQTHDTLFEISISLDIPKALDPSGRVHLRIPERISNPGSSLKNAIKNIIQFGTGLYHGATCMRNNIFISDPGQCEGCFYVEIFHDWCRKIYDIPIEIKDISAKAKDITLLLDPTKQSQPKEADRSRQNDTEGFIFANSSHPCFSIELNAAVLCWQALYGAGTKECLKNRKANIREWLKNNCKDLKGEAIERVATIVNPNRLKKGGATPIS